jgi:hypothetical protein
VQTSFVSPEAPTCAGRPGCCRSDKEPRSAMCFKSYSCVVVRTMPCALTDCHYTVLLIVKNQTLSMLRLLRVFLTQRHASVQNTGCKHDLLNAKCNTARPSLQRVDEVRGTAVDATSQPGCSKHQPSLQCDTAKLENDDV